MKAGVMKFNARGRSVSCFFCSIERMIPEEKME